MGNRGEGVESELEASPKLETVSFSSSAEEAGMEVVAHGRAE